MLNLIERFLLKRLEKKKRDVIRLRWEKVQLEKLLKELREKKENENERLV